MEADEDMDGKISFEEFQKMVENTVSTLDGFLEFSSSAIQDLFSNEIQQDVSMSMTLDQF